MVTDARPRTRGLSRRVSNLVLLVVVLVVLLTGLGSWLLPPTDRWLVVAHGVAGLAVVGLVRWKAPVVRSGLGRARASRWASVALAVLVVVALVTGLLHTGGLVRLGPQRTMWWHVAAGLVLLPLLVWHALARRQRPRRTDLDRRLLLTTGGVAALAGGAWLLLEGGLRLVGLPGAGRRPTGSYDQALPQPTIWLFDRVPAVDPDRWRLTVSDDAGRRELSLAELTALPAVTARVVIDCTSGWASEQDWTGVPLADLVDVGAGRSVVVRSVTGYSRRFAPDELDGVLLAHAMAGEPLLRQLGAPLRLVVPDRRGFWWVKWVDAVEVDDRPAWAQPAFPLR